MEAYLSFSETGCRSERFPKNILPLSDLYDWQSKALAEWMKAGKKGIIEAVTGSGKTHVGIGAIAALRPQVRLVNGELEEEGLWDLLLRDGAPMSLAEMDLFDEPLECAVFDRMEDCVKRMIGSDWEVKHARAFPEPGEDLSLEDLRKLDRLGFAFSDLECEIEGDAAWERLIVNAVFEDSLGPQALALA